MDPGDVITIPVSIFEGVDLTKELKAAALLYDYAAEYLSGDTDDKAGAAERYLMILRHMHKKPET